MTFVAGESGSGGHVVYVGMKEKEEGMKEEEERRPG